MAEVITIKEVNAVYDKIGCDRGIQAELNDYFTFKVPGYQFHPLFKQKIWSGDIHLFSVKNNLLYGGLRSHVERFAKERDYEVEYLFDNAATEFSVKEAKAFIATLNLPVDRQPHDYQVDTFVHCVRSGRRLVLSPTGSGKSLMIYLLFRYYAEQTLIIVPTIGLVHQMFTDFQDYGFDSEAFCHKVYQGQSLLSDKPITISTWQSLYKQPKEYYDDVRCIIIDEAHLATAKSLKDIMEKAEKTYYRTGWTGTLDGTATHKLVLEGLFGEVYKGKSTAELIEDGFLSPLKVKMILLKYPEIARKLLNKATYADEMDYIVSASARNRFIKNLAESLEGNTLILFRYIDKHGKPLYDDIKNSLKDRNVYYVDGGTKGTERDELRAIIEKEENAIIIASYGTFSTGINIRRLHNVVFASPYKSQIKILQSIGRGLRKVDGKEHCTVYDIGDDLSYKKNQNHTLKHFILRMKIYHQEKFNPKVYNVGVKSS
jgi:superfamily II DNA or RNA helicase